MKRRFGRKRGIIRWLGLKDSLEDIREKIDTVDQSFAEVTAELLDDQVKRFALQKRATLLKSCISMPTKGWIVIKFVALWQKEPDASTKSRLSFVCKRVKQNLVMRYERRDYYNLLGKRVSNK